MFVRASFARGKAFQDNGIRCWKPMRSGAEMFKLWKNVEFLTPFIRRAAGYKNAVARAVDRRFACREGYTAAGQIRLPQFGFASYNGAGFKFGHGVCLSAMLLLQADPRMRVECLAFSPDGHTLAVGGTGFSGVALVDLLENKTVQRFSGHRSSVRALAFAPEGDLIASTDRHGYVKVWHVADGREKSSFTTWYKGTNCVAFSPDGRVLAAGSVSWLTAAQVRRWEVASGRELPGLRGHDHEITSLSFSPDGQILATGSRDNSIRIWDANSGLQRSGIASRVADFLRLFGWGAPPEEQKNSLLYDTAIRCLTFSPDGRMLAAATGFRATLWHAESGRLLTTLKDHRALVTEVAFSPDGRTLATASRDGTVKFWNVSDFADAPRRMRRRAALATFDWSLGKIYSLAFAPDATRIAAGGDGGKIVVWDLDGF